MQPRRKTTRITTFVEGAGGAGGATQEPETSVMLLSPSQLFA